MEPLKMVQLAGQAAVATLVWRHVFARALSQFIKRHASRQSWWPLLRKRRGGAFIAAQPEFVLAATVAIHHIISGLLMSWGARTKNTLMWQIGMLLELGYELGDLVNLSLGQWPFDDDNAPPEVKVGVVLHHVPATLLYLPVFSFGLDENTNIQRMCGALLLPSGLTALAACCGYTLDITKPIPGIVGAAIRTAGTLYFAWTRMVDYPANLASVYADVRADSSLPWWLTGGVIASGLFMGCFNLLMVTDSVIKMVKHNLMIARGNVEGEFLPQEKKE